MKIYINKITKFYPYEAVFVSGVFMETWDEGEYYDYFFIAEEQKEDALRILNKALS